MFGETGGLRKMRENQHRDNFTNEQQENKHSMVKFHDKII